MPGIVLPLWQLLKPRPEHVANPAADADSFAQAVGGEIRREYDRRKVEDPAPIGVRWSRCEVALLDTSINTFGSDAFPNLAQVRDISERYKRIPSGRMVIVGRAGSGKSVLAMQLAAALIEGRSPGDPVPVILNVAGWDAHNATLRDWLASELVQKYEQLEAARDHNRTVADVLLDQRLILPILDGFDELPPSTCGAAMSGLNDMATLPLVITSRTGRYAETVATCDVLTRADGVAIQSLSLDDLEDYLPRTTTRRDPSGQNLWRAILTRIRNDSGAHAVRMALKTPLIAFLLRSVYSDVRDNDPAELLDTARFSTPQRVETHLLESFIDATYAGSRSQYQPADVRRWLGGIAADMKRMSRLEMGWWQFRDGAGALERATVFCVLGSIGGAAVLWPLSPWFGAGVGAGMGLGVSVNGRGPRPSVVRFQALRGTKAAMNSAVALAGADLALLLAIVFTPAQGIVGHRSLQHAFPSALWAASIGLGVGLVLGLVDSAAKRRAGSPGHQQVAVFARGFLMGLLGTFFLGYLPGFAFGALTGIVAGIVARFEGAPDLDRTPSVISSLRTDRAVTIGKFVGFGSLVGVPVAVFSAPAGPATAAVLGLATAAANGFGIALGMNAWGHWLVLTRIWLVVTRRLPADLIGFLDDAHNKGVLRQIGGMYQFRHSSLEQSLLEARSATKVN